MCLRQRFVKLVSNVNSNYPWILHVFLMTSIVIYCFFGGSIFIFLEGDALAAQREEHIMTCLQKHRSKLNGSEGTLGLPAAESLLRDCMHVEEESGRWTLLGSALFGFGIVTTLGVGRPSPITDGGKLFCVLFALIGIPLTMFVLSNVGKTVKELYCSTKTRFKERVIERELARRQRAGQADRGEVSAMVAGASEDDVTVTLRDKKADERAVEATGAVVLVALLAYIVLGSIFVTLASGKGLIHGLYNTFLSITALQFEAFMSNWYIVPIVLPYICIGISLATVAVDVGSDYLKRFHFLGKKLTNAGETWIWFGGKRVCVKEYTMTVCDSCGVPRSTINNLDYTALAERSIRISEGKERLYNPVAVHDLMPLFDSDAEDDDDDDQNNGVGSPMQHTPEYRIETSKRALKLTPLGSPVVSTAEIVPPQPPQMAAIMDVEPPEFEMCLDSHPPIEPPITLSEIQSAVGVLAPPLVVGEPYMVFEPFDEHLGIAATTVVRSREIVSADVARLTDVLPLCECKTTEPPELMFKESTTTAVAEPPETNVIECTESEEMTTRLMLTEADQHLLESTADTPCSSGSNVLSSKRRRNTLHVFATRKIARSPETDSGVAKSFQSKHQKFGTDANKLYAAYQEEWDRMKKKRKSESRKTSMK